MARLKFSHAFLGILLCSATGFGLQACSDDNGEETNSSIQITGGNNQAPNFAANELEGTLTFVAQAPWTAYISETTAKRAAPDWISLDRYSGEAGEQTLNITLLPNNTGNDRSADIVIACNGEEIRVSVTQTATAGSEDGDKEEIAETDEWDWVEYTTLYIMEDGTDHNIEGDHYLFFDEPGFFRPGRTNGELPHLKDMGAMSWKEFSIMPEPEVIYSEGWSTERIPCVKGHGYFSGLSDYDYQGSGLPQHVRFWVEDYIMQGDEIVGAKLRCTAKDYPDLTLAQEDGAKYELAWAGSVISFRAPRSIRGELYGNSAAETLKTYVIDGGPMEYDEWVRIMKVESSGKESEIPAFNETDWKYETDIPCVKGHGYFARIVSFKKSTGEIDSVQRCEGVYVRDYLTENGEIVGLVLDFRYGGYK